MTSLSPNITSDEFDALPLRPCVGIMLLNSSRKVWIGRRITKAHDDPNALIGLPLIKLNAMFRNWSVKIL